MILLDLCSIALYTVKADSEIHNSFKIWNVPDELGHSSKLQQTIFLLQENFVFPPCTFTHNLQHNAMVYSPF